jgi:iron complex transport system substrate-binding protein
VPSEKRPLVYYARGLRGFQTGLKGSINVESIERIGARNVAAERIGQGSLMSVSPEQLLAWNPEIVITAEAAFLAIVATDEVWKSIRAVRSGRVYVAPALPFPYPFRGGCFQWQPGMESSAGIGLRQRHSENRQLGCAPVRHPAALAGLSRLIGTMPES